MLLSHRPAYRAALLSTLGLGLILWLVNYAHDRPIFLDEANLARNLYDRSFTGLFLPLDHEQYAPPLYLLLSKALAELAGYREWVLRLPALLGGLLAIMGLHRAGREMKLGAWVLLPLALLFVNPTVLRYVTEFKPYGLDLGLASLLLAWELSAERDRPYAWAAAGVVAPWLSLPSVFVLAAVGLRHLLRDLRWIWVIASWLVSFGGLYWLVLRPSVGSQYLNEFHARYFMPLPLSWEETKHAGYLIYYLLRLSFGYTVVALIAGAGVLTVGLATRDVRNRYAWLLLPLLVTVAASHLKLYTLIDRLMLFSLPGIWLFSTVTVSRLYERSGRWARLALLLVVGLTLGSTNIYRALLRPYRFTDSGELAVVARRNPDYLADGSAVPVLDYYLRVRDSKAETVVRRPPSDGSLPIGDYPVLFDGTNNKATREAIRNFQQRAAERGCKAEYRELFRSGILRIKCP